MIGTWAYYMNKLFHIHLKPSICFFKKPFLHYFSFVLIYGNYYIILSVGWRWRNGILIFIVIYLVCIKLGYEDKVVF